MSGVNGHHCARPAAELRMARPSIPCLGISGPIKACGLVIAIFCLASLGIASTMSIDAGVPVAGAVVVEMKLRPIQHGAGGQLGQVHVHVGQDVAAGDILMTLDAAKTGAQIAALKRQAAEAMVRLDHVRREMEATSATVESDRVDHVQVAALQRRVLEVEQQTAGFTAQIAIAERELRQMEVRAPVAGTVLRLSVRDPGSVIEPGAVVAEIMPAIDRLMLEARLTPQQAHEARSSTSVKVWLAVSSLNPTSLGSASASSASAPLRAPFTARLARLTREGGDDTPAGAAGSYLALVEIDEPRALIAQRIGLASAQHARLLLVTHERRLLDTMIEPLARLFTIHRGGGAPPA